MMRIDERIVTFSKIDATPRFEVVDAYLEERNAVGVSITNYLSALSLLNGRKVKT